MSSAKMQTHIHHHGCHRKRLWCSETHSQSESIYYNEDSWSFRPIEHVTGLVGAFCLALLFPSYLDAQSALPKINAAYVSSAGGFAVMWIAQEAKVFTKYGLDLQLIRVPGSPRLVQAVIGGDIHFAHTGGVSTANALARGADIVVLAQTEAAYSGHLVVKADIAGVDGLRGKRVGVPQYGSTADLFLREGLKKWNLRPDRDVTILQVGGTTEVLAALLAERIDAAVLAGELALRARKSGFLSLFRFRELDIREQGSSVIARRSFVREKENTVRVFLKAFVEGIYLYKTNKDLSLRVLQKYTRNDDYEMLAAVREEYTKYMEAIPYANELNLIGSLSRIEKDLTSLERKTQGASVAQFIESKYLKELDESGFVKQLYR